MIDKNKAYRFRGDSEAWTYDAEVPGEFLAGWRNNRGGFMKTFTFEHLLSRGILLEYPELPGEDWEFCDAEGGEAVWDEAREWVNRSYVTDCEDGIYCRKKKPVYESGTVQCVVKTYCTVGDRIDRIDLPSGFAGPGDRVKVTKL